MTVAAVILSATPDGAVADTLGQPRVRRLVDIAWAGGAMPVVVVAADPDGVVATALVGSEAILAQPAPIEGGPVGQMLRGAEVAASEVRETTGCLVWPARMTWVGPETVTSLIEAHGMAADAVLRPAWGGEPGWPVLVPTAHLATMAAIGPDGMPADIIEELVATVPSRLLDLGDPGVTHDVDTPRADLPPYEGPPDPPAGHRHEWGEDVEAEAGLPAPDATA
jgi:CTP:molybdopterin cytidylyltransferase MocA